MSFLPISYNLSSLCSPFLKPQATGKKIRVFDLSLSHLLDFSTPIETISPPSKKASNQGRERQRKREIRRSARFRAFYGTGSKEESTGAYYAAARIAGATPPPAHVITRSIALQKKLLEDQKGPTPSSKIHSSMYASLRLTSSREIMGFTDFPFFSASPAVKKGMMMRDMRRFPSHSELLLYLKDFCHWFGLREFIRFNTTVEYVGMLNYAHEFGKDPRWLVRSVEKNTGKVMEEVFDAVVVATRHYSHPRLPTIKDYCLFQLTLYRQSNLKRVAST